MSRDYNGLKCMGRVFLQQGFREIEHAADWEIEVWAPDLPGLFIEAAQGMYSLSGTKLSLLDEGRAYEFEIPFTNPESILVAFLNELLFQSEQNGIGITNLELDIDDFTVAGSRYRTTNPFKK